MRAFVLAAAASLLVASARPASADVRLTIENGQVTLSASNATIAQILAEWSRVGQTRIVNGERIASAPLTMELSHVNEAQALDIILRSVSGYVLAPRNSAAAAASASRFDRIYILPTAAPPRPVATAASAPPAPFPQNRFVPPPPPPDDPDDEPVVPRPGNNVPPADNGGNNRTAPSFMTFPTPQQAPPANGGSFGVATPGMVVPTPAPPANRDIRSTPQPQ